DARPLSFDNESGPTPSGSDNPTPTRRSELVRVAFLAHAFGDELLVLLHAIAFALGHGVERGLALSANARGHSLRALHARGDRRLSFATIEVGRDGLPRRAFLLPLRGAAGGNEERDQNAGVFHRATLGSG